MIQTVKDMIIIVTINLLIKNTKLEVGVLQFRNLQELLKA